MGFKDPEDKKAYNKAYYAKNKVRSNADRIITDLKNNDQRCVKQTTLVKYDEGFDDNQLLFLDNLVENCKVESRAKFELPTPQPIVEAPVIPDLPFIQKLPETRFFKENTNKDTFTIDEARAIIHGFRTVNNGGTEKSYYDKVNAIMTKFNLDRKNGLWSDVYKKGFKTIIEVLKKHYKNPSGYIVMLLYI